MVELHQSGRNECWIDLRPNRALNRGQLHFMLLLLALPGLIVALGFLITGVWMVLPFWGLELSACWAAIWWVWRCSGRRELIRFQAEWVLIERGMLYPVSRHRFQRAWARFEVQHDEHPWYPDRIFLCQSDRREELGSFLDDAEKSRLVELLRAQVQTHAGLVR